MALTLTACERDTEVTVDGKNPPTFKVSGNGGINFFRVYQWPAPPESWRGHGPPAIWQLDPVGGAIRIRDVPDILYGRVPAGFEQTKPDHGPPPALEEGKVYLVWAPTFGANGGGVTFTIKDARSVPTEVPAPSLPPLSKLRVALEGDPPAFVLSGQGTLTGLLVSEVPSGRILWEIGTDDVDQPLDKLRAIKYGEVPSGFKQTARSGNPPPALMNGRQYHYFLYGETVVSASGDFTMVDGKPVITQAQ
jgi:hypothetical protein